MMRVLIAGGTATAKQLALQLHQQGVAVLYSVAGITSPPDFPFPVLSGGFGGVDGLVKAIQQQHITHIIDATHPYAAQIGHHLALAAKQCACPVWRLERAPWIAEPSDAWFFYEDYEQLLANCRQYHRLFFSTGISILKTNLQPLPHQHWFIRCLPATANRYTTDACAANISVIADRGPFDYEKEQALFTRLKPDLLISKNSGGTQRDAKLIIAQQRRIDVAFLTRPDRPDYDQHFTDADALIHALRN